MGHEDPPHIRILTSEGLRNQQGLHVGNMGRGPGLVGQSGAGLFGLAFVKGNSNLGPLGTGKAVEPSTPSGLLRTTVCIFITWPKSHLAIYGYSVEQTDWRG